MPDEKDKIRVGLWIKKIIDSDKAHGRSQNDFNADNMELSVRSAAPVMNLRGFDVYQGGGNIFYVKYYPKGPIAIQTRPLAQRVVRLKFSD